jgi:hypothetical protein
LTPLGLAAFEHLTLGVQRRRGSRRFAFLQIFEHQL